MKTSKFSIKAIQIHVQSFIIMVSCMRIIIKHSFTISQHNQACIQFLMINDDNDNHIYITCEDLRV